MKGSTEMVEMQRLHQQGLSQVAIAAEVGCDRKTVRKYLAQRTAPRYGPRAPRATKLEAFRDQLDAWLAAGMWNAVVLFERLRAAGYTGGQTRVRDYVRPRRAAARAAAVRRFETEPGEQAQVDWGELGTFTRADGAVQRVSVFIMVLSHSRAAFRALATDQTVPTLLRLHEAAFQALGGVPRRVLYDRPRTILTGCDAHGEPAWQPTFRAFADYYGFVPQLCAAYRAQTKGKVESSVRYVRGNFLCGRTAADVADLDRQLQAWTTTSNARVHGTTHRVVAEAWAAERPTLRAVVGMPAFPLDLRETRRVARDAFVDWHSSRYSVPWAWAGMAVQVQEQDGQVTFACVGYGVVTHPASRARHQVVVDPVHHRDLPLGPTGRPRGKVMLHLTEAPPDVPVRALAAYGPRGEG